MIELWSYYRVNLEFITKLVGSTPSDPAIQEQWVKSRAPKNKPANTKSIEDIAQEVLESTEQDEEEPKLLVFQRHQGIVVVRAATIRAHYKDGAGQLSSMYVGRIEKEKSFAVKVKNAVYLRPEDYWLPVMRDGQPVREVDGTYDKPIHVRNPQGGTSNAIKTMEYFEPGTSISISFILKVMRSAPTKDKDGKVREGRDVVSEADIYTLFEYGGTHGYGGERGDGEGRYSYSLERVDAKDARSEPAFFAAKRPLSNGEAARESAISH